MHIVWTIARLYWQNLKIGAQIVVRIGRVVLALVDQQGRFERWILKVLDHEQHSSLDHKVVRQDGVASGRQVELFAIDLQEIGGVEFKRDT